MGRTHTLSLVVALTLSAPGISSAQTTPPPQPQAGVVGAASPAAIRRELPWRGGPIPPGYVLHRSPRVALLVAGSALFVGAYLPAVYVGAEYDLPWLAVPVFGPLVASFYAFGTALSDRCFLVTFVGIYGGLVALADALAQTAGIVLTTIGVARPRQVLRYEPTQAGLAWSIHPGAGSAPVGLTLSLTPL